MVFKTNYSLSYFNITSGLRVSPEDRIEKARADMLLKSSTAKLQNLATLQQQYQQQYQEQLEKLQQEHAKLMVKLNAYYDTKRQLLELKKQDIRDRVEHSQLNERYQLFQSNWAEQKKQWLKFNQQLLFTPAIAN